MKAPINVPIQWMEIKEMHLSKTKPVPSEGYEIIQVHSWGQMKLWQEYRIVPEVS